MSTNRTPSEILCQAPGINALSELVAIDPFSLDRLGRLDFLAALEKQSAWLQAIMQSAIIAVAGEAASQADARFNGVDEMEREDIATALRLSHGTAQIRIDVARTLTQHLPATCSALASGDISPAQATVIARESAAIIRQGISMEALREIEEGAIAHSEFHTPAQVANKVRGIIAKVAPIEFEESAADSSAARQVTLYPEPNGMATIVALLPAADAQTVMLAIDKLARIAQANTDAPLLKVWQKEHRLDNLRADALTQLASAYLAESSNTNMNHRRPVTVNLTIDLPTLLGFAENPGILAGYGAIPASVARELAADGKWRRFITDPITGVLLDYGRESYEPPQILVDFLMARDRTCRFPGCRQPARIADIDHAKAWGDGGVTSAENLGLLCRRHHRMKTHGNWSLESFSDGSCEWTSPVGKKFFVPARSANEVA